MNEIITPYTHNKTVMHACHCQLSSLKQPYEGEHVKVIVWDSTGLQDGHH